MLNEKLINAINSTLDANATDGSERRLKPSDSKIISSVIGNLDEPDKRIIRSIKYDRTRIIERIKNINVPQMVNGEPAEFSVLSFKIDNGVLIRRNESEIESYLEQTNTEQLIQDLLQVVQVITSDEQLQQYYKDHKLKKDKKQPIPSDEKVQSRLSKEDAEKYKHLDSYVSSVMAENKDVFEFLNSELHLSSQEFEQKLSNFLNNYMIINLDSARQLQIDHKTAVDAGGTQEMYFVLGGPGAGKSSTISTLKNEMYAFHAEADEIKNQLALVFGIDVNAPIIHKLSGLVLKGILIPTCIDMRINFILEKIGDEPHKIEHLARQYIEKGYETNLYCIHIDTAESRIRNIVRALEYMKKGDPPRMVEDSSAKNMGYNPLLTYIMMTQICGELFKSGECKVNQNPYSIDPQTLCTLNHGTARNEEFINDYIKDAKVYQDYIINALFERFLTKNPDLSPECLRLIEVYKDRVLDGNPYLGDDLFENLSDQEDIYAVCQLFTMTKSALNNAFNPLVIVSPNPISPFSIPIDQEFDVCYRSKTIHFGNNQSRINMLIESITSKDNELYKRASVEAERLFAKMIANKKGVEA